MTKEKLTEAESVLYEIERLESHLRQFEKTDAAQHMIVFPEFFDVKAYTENVQAKLDLLINEFNNL